MIVGDEVCVRPYLGRCEAMRVPRLPGDGKGGSCPVLRTEIECCKDG